MTQNKTNPTPKPQPSQTQAKQCSTDLPEETICPNCESTMRLWANYYRCRNCGYKESCCF